MVISRSGHNRPARPLVCSGLSGWGLPRIDTTPRFSCPGCFVGWSQSVSTHRSRLRRPECRYNLLGIVPDEVFLGREVTSHYPGRQRAHVFEICLNGDRALLSVRGQELRPVPGGVHEDRVGCLLQIVREDADEIRGAIPVRLAPLRHQIDDEHDLRVRLGDRLAYPAHEQRGEDAGVQVAGAEDDPRRALQRLARLHRHHRRGVEKDPGDRGDRAGRWLVDVILTADDLPVGQRGAQGRVLQRHGHDVPHGVEHLLRVAERLPQVARVEVLERAQDEIAQAVAAHPAAGLAGREAVGEQVPPEATVARLGDQPLPQVAHRQRQAELVHQLARAAAAVRGGVDRGEQPRADMGAQAAEDRISAGAATHHGHRFADPCRHAVASRAMRLCPMLTQPCPSSIGYGSAVLLTRYTPQPEETWMREER